MNHFQQVHTLLAQQRRDRDDALLPLAHQRARIVELETALQDLIRVGDALKMHKTQMERWHEAALAAEKVLNNESEGER